jgi:hypothetical protein
VEAAWRAVRLDPHLSADFCKQLPMIFSLSNPLDSSQQAIYVENSHCLWNRKPWFGSRSGSLRPLSNVRIFAIMEMMSFRYFWY